MLDRRHRELISAGIDGELTPREQAELVKLLAASDEARALHAELTELRDHGQSARDVREEIERGWLAEQQRFQRILAAVASALLCILLRPRWGLEQKERRGGVWPGLKPRPLFAAFYPRAAIRR